MFSVGCSPELEPEIAPVPGATSEQPSAPTQDASAAVGEANDAIEQQQQQIDDLDAE
jgi:hypothetical protein